jgi:hypothetical protein
MSWQDAPIVQQGTPSVTPAWQTAPVVPAQSANAPNASQGAQPDEGHSPVQDVVDMVTSAVSSLGPQLKQLFTQGIDPDAIIAHVANTARSAIENPSATISSVGSVLRNATPQQVGQNVLGPLVLGEGLGAAGKLAGAGIAGKALSPTEALGLRTGGTGPGTNFLAGAAGNEGRAAVSTQNVNAATRAAGNQVGVPNNVDVTPAALDQAKVVPGKLLDDAAASLPIGPLSPNAAAQLRAARGPATITKPTPNVENQIKDIESLLLNPNGQFTGEQIRATRNSLSSDATAGANSDDADTRALSQYKRNVVAALDQHVADTLPANGPYSLDQVNLARQTLAQNYTVGDLLKGPYLDLQGLGKLHADNPNLLTGDLRTLGQFAVDHPEVSGLPSPTNRFAPPGYVSGLGKALGPGGGDIGARLSNIFGIQPVATRLLTGRPSTSKALAAGRPVTGLAGEFEPQPGMQGPTGGPLGPPPSRQLPLPLAPGSGQVVNPTGGLTASSPSAPVAPAAGAPGQIPLVDLLSHGVEQSPSPGLSLAPMGAPEPQGIPFTQNAEHMAGGLQVDPNDWLNKFLGENNSDLPAVKSQGVPEGTVQRTAPQQAPEPVEGGGLKFRSPNGQTIVRKRGDTLQVSASLTKQTAQGAGEGTQRMVDAYNFARANGLRLVSDTKVSNAAAKVYDKLERMGYQVTRNPVEPDGKGNIVSTAGRPAFEVSGPPTGLADLISGAGGG